MNFKKQARKRLCQSDLTDFIQIIKMSKDQKQVSTTDQKDVINIDYKNEEASKVSQEATTSEVPAAAVVSLASSSSVSCLSTSTPIINLLEEDHNIKEHSTTSSDPQNEIAMKSSQNSVEQFSLENDKSEESDGSCSENDSATLRRTTDCQPKLPPLRPSDSHSVLFNYNLVPGLTPLPYPKCYRDKWDNNYVRLPCSESNKYPILNGTTGEQELKPRWDIIQTALLSDIRSSGDLEEAILTYNSQYAGKWNFQGLHKLFNEEFNEEENSSFFQNLLPKMIRLCLKLPIICTQPIPLLKVQMDHKITLSKLQISCLLANAFFCTFPRRNTQNRSSEYSSYPDINFNKLFSFVGYTTKVEKLKCLLSYFNSITRKPVEGVVTFHRQHVDDFPKWKLSKKPMSKLVVQSEGLIEVDGLGMLQIDFANKFVGGGVLNSGCVQEEIRFVICPELIISRLFTERLHDNEVLIVTGCEQFNRYSGYADNFEWDGSYEDHVPRDSWQRKLTQVVAMDALHFATSEKQFQPSFVYRELEKSFTGFVDFETPPNLLPAIATGNWGCGAFRGDPHLKAIIQLISASEAGRDMLYLTFDDDDLRKDIQKMYSFLKGKPVGAIVRMLENYHLSLGQDKEKAPLYSFLFNSLALPSESDTDVDS